VAKKDDDGIGVLDAVGTPITTGARVVYATSRARGLLKEGVVTRVTPVRIGIRRWDGKIITIGTAKRIAVLPPRAPDAKPPQMAWAEFCRRNRERSLGSWADEELRLAQERLRKRDKDELDNWWNDYKEGL